MKSSLNVFFFNIYGQFMWRSRFMEFAILNNNIYTLYATSTFFNRLCRENNEEAPTNQLMYSEDTKLVRVIFYHTVSQLSPLSVDTSCCCRSWFD